MHLHARVATWMRAYWLTVKLPSGCAPAAGTSDQREQRGRSAAASCRRLPELASSRAASGPYSGWKRGLRALRAPQCRDRLGALAGTGRDRAEVVGEHRIGALQLLAARASGSAARQSPDRNSAQPSASCAYTDGRSLTAMRPSRTASARLP